MILYRAYKGKEDLPLHIEIDSLYVGHRGQDTLIYVHAMRLHGNVQKVENGKSSKDFTARTIVVDQLLLEQTTFHSDTMIDADGVDVILRHLNVKSPGLNIAKGDYPLHGLKMADAFVGIELRDTTSDPDDTTSTPMAFDVQDGELRNVRFLLNPMGLDLRAGTLTTNVLADVGGDLFDFYFRDEKLYFCIGDVSGKGVPASLFMAVTRSAFRTVSARVDARPHHDHDEQDGNVVAILSGSLNTAVAAETEKAMGPLYDVEGKNIILDCTELEYISSAGLRIFLSLLHSAEGKGGHVYIKGVNNELRDIFTITGFSNIFEFM